MKDSNALPPMKIVSATVAGMRHKRSSGRSDEEGKARAFPFQRRYVYQAASHLEEVIGRLWDFRQEANKEYHLDDAQDLTEALYHLAKARAYLNHASHRRFLKDAIDLEAYK